uniref:Uncharacterized protein n=1 Tax=Heterorhabditis bacteriophora TaxID=37862 RepID=A0A1I7WYH4_HETBA
MDRCASLKTYLFVVRICSIKYVKKEIIFKNIYIIQIFQILTLQVFWYKTVKCTITPDVMLPLQRAYFRSWSTVLIVGAEKFISTFRLINQLHIYSISTNNSVVFIFSFSSHSRCIYTVHLILMKTYKNR